MALLEVTVVVGVAVAADLCVVDESRLQAAAATFAGAYHQTREEIEAGEMEHQQQALEFHESSDLEWTPEDERDARQDERRQHAQEPIAALPYAPAAAVVEQINQSPTEAGAPPLPPSTSP